MCNTALLSDFLGSMYKYQRNYKHMLTHCYHAIDAIEKIEQISHLVPKLCMTALSDFAWKKSIFSANYHVRKNSLFSCLNTNSLTYKPMNCWKKSSVFSLEQFVSLETIYPRSLIVMMNFCYFLEFKTRAETFVPCLSHSL